MQLIVLHGAIRAVVYRFIVVQRCIIFISDNSGSRLVTQARVIINAQNVGHSIVIAVFLYNVFRKIGIIQRTKCLKLSRKKSQIDVILEQLRNAPRNVCTIFPEAKVAYKTGFNTVVVDIHHFFVFICRIKNQIIIQNRIKALDRSVAMTLCILYSVLSVPGAEICLITVFTIGSPRRIRLVGTVCFPNRHGIKHIDRPQIRNIAFKGSCKFKIVIRIRDVGCVYQLCIRNRSLMKIIILDSVLRKCLVQIGAVYGWLCNHTPVAFRYVFQCGFNACLGIGIFG